MELLNTRTQFCCNLRPKPANEGACQEAFTLFEESRTQIPNSGGQLVSTLNSQLSTFSLGDLCRSEMRAEGWRAVRYVAPLGILAIRKRWRAMWACTGMAGYDDRTT